jgi:Nif-specific regulatory protein
LRLAEFFLETFCRNMGRTTPQLSPAAQKQLLDHRWPGNVRELRNLTERLAYLTSGNRIEAEDLAFINTGEAGESTPLRLDATLPSATKQFQREYIRQMIAAAKGNMSRAAKRLGLHRSNLYRKMRQLEMAGGEEQEADEA